MKNLLCRISGHNVICSQQALLLPEGGAMFYHQHDCRRCGRFHRYPTEWLDNAEEQAIRQALPPITAATTVSVEPDYAHRGRTH